jgi:hypothetical protein
VAYAVRRWPKCRYAAHDCTWNADCQLFVTSPRASNLFNVCFFEFQDVPDFKQKVHNNASNNIATLPLLKYKRFPFEDPH